MSYVVVVHLTQQIRCWRTACIWNTYTLYTRWCVKQHGNGGWCYLNPLTTPHLELSWCPALGPGLSDELQAQLWFIPPSAELPWLLPLKLVQDNHIVLLLKLGSVTMCCHTIYAIMNLLRTLPRLQSFIIITTTTHSAAASQTCNLCLTMLEKNAFCLLKVLTIAFTLLRIINRDP